MSSQEAWAGVRTDWERGRELAREARFAQHRRRLDHNERVIDGGEFDEHRRRLWKYIRWLERRLHALEQRGATR